LVSGYFYYKLYKSFVNRNQENLKKEYAKNENKQKINNFNDIGGCEQAKEAIREIIDFVRNPKEFREMGIRMPKGILLYGPSGTGKTLIAKACAFEANIPFLSCVGSEFVEIYVGVGAKRIRELFN